jgi:hypothetical protein
MANTPQKSGKQWTGNDVSKLKKLVNGNTPTRLIAYELGRSEGAIRSKVSKLDISLKPTNKSPYNKRNK